MRRLQKRPGRGTACRSPHTGTARVGGRQKAADPAAAREAKSQEEGLRWSYSERQDAMGRGTVKFASVMSLNKFEFRFPHQGRQQQRLLCASHPGRCVGILSVERATFVQPVFRVLLSWPNSAMGK